MPVAKVIIISGPPCTGKTTLAKKVAKIFHLPIVSCDSIRELLYDELGCFDLVMFKKNRKASFILMYNIIELLLNCRQPQVVDSTFWSRENRKKIEGLQRKYRFRCLQVNLRALGQILWERYRKRVLSGCRNPGYLDYLRRKELKRKITKGFSISPKIRGRTIVVDTTDFKKVDFNRLLKTIKNFLKD
ncbi:MAG: AAA family ATPase [Patescibacteria group bacterium]|nr:AAA family ATPase [Patescibacteria group bacterium]